MDVGLRDGGAHNDWRTIWPSSIQIIVLPAPPTTKYYVKNLSALQYLQNGGPSIVEYWRVLHDFDNHGPPIIRIMEEEEEDKTTI